jgi:hypothetical protein
MITTQQQRSFDLDKKLSDYQNRCTWSNFLLFSLILGPPERGRVVDNSSSSSYLLSLARGISIQPCCKRLCMWQGGDTTLEMASQLVLSCLEEVQNMSKKEKLQYLRYFIIYLH